jgi:hydrogenase maturation protease
VAEADPARVAVIGLGNELRGDDAAGLVAAREVRQCPRAAGIRVNELEGEAARLLDYWEGCAGAVILDAMRSGAAAGTIRRFDVTCVPLPGEVRGSSSTHAVGMREALELGRALDRLPPRVVVYGIEGLRFDVGEGLSEPVLTRLPELVRVSVDEAVALRDDRVS